VLREATSDDHCGLPEEALIQNAQKLLEISRELIITAIEKELEKESITKDIIGDTQVVFLTAYYIYEKNIAKMLLGIILILM